MLIQIIMIATSIFLLLILIIIIFQKCFGTFYPTIVTTIIDEGGLLFEDHTEIKVVYKFKTKFHKTIRGYNTTEIIQLKSTLKDQIKEGGFRL